MPKKKWRFLLFFFPEVVPEQENLGGSARPFGLGLRWVFCFPSIFLRINRSNRCRFKSLEFELRMNLTEPVPD